MLKRISAGAALLALAFAASGASFAQSEDTAKRAPLATVEAVQMPAWVERNDSDIPLVPGMALEDNDQVRTGGRARVLMRSADGSAIKLGENAALSFAGLRMREDNVFEGALKLAEGAFRFTSEFFSAFRGRRELQIGLRTVTAGIRGTDIWGKSTAEKEVVVLIEGKVEITESGRPAFDVDERFTIYVNENGVGRPVVRIPADELEAAAAETETQDGMGVVTRGGRWKVTIMPGLAHNEALDLYEGLRRSGYAAEIIPAKVEDKRVYNVRLSHFEAKSDAEALAAALKEERGEYTYRVGQ